MMPTQRQRTATEKREMKRARKKKTMTWKPVRPMKTATLREKTARTRTSRATKTMPRRRARARRERKARSANAITSPYIIVWKLLFVCVGISFRVFAYVTCPLSL
jgi:hypothetical protein